MARWRDPYEDDFERDWWKDDEEENHDYPYGRYPWTTIMGMPYPLAIDIMRGKWPPGREEGGLFDDGGAFDLGGDDTFWDPFGGGGDFFDGGGMDM